MNEERGKGRGMYAPVVVLTTSKTTTTRVLSMLPYTTMACGNVSAMLTSFGESGRHCLFSQNRVIRTMHPKSIDSIQAKQGRIMELSSSAPSRSVPESETHIGCHEE